MAYQEPLAQALQVVWEVGSVPAENLDLLGNHLYCLTALRSRAGWPTGSEWRNYNIYFISHSAFP